MLILRKGYIPPIQVVLDTIRRLYHQFSHRFFVMGSAQSIPIIGEAVTAVEMATKTIAAGACALVGKQKQAEELLDGVKKSWVNYTEVNLIVGGVRALVDEAEGNHAEANRLRDKQRKAWHSVAISTPGIGHAIGFYHYAIGDREGGDAVMIEANKSSLIAIAGIATGGAGFFAAAAAGTATSLAYDLFATEVTHEDYGFIAAANHAEKTGNADDIFNAAEDPASSFIPDLKVGLGPQARMPGKLRPFSVPILGPDHDISPPSPSLRDEPTAGHSLARLGGGRSTSVFSKYGSRRPPAISVEEVEDHPKMRERFSEHQNPAKAMQAMRLSSSYDFVRMKNGRVRFVDHSDATKIAHALQSGGAVHGDAVINHASLVKASEQHEVVSAGEASCGLEHVLHGITPGAGSFHLPIQLMTRLIDEYFPHGVLALDSPLFTRLLGWVSSQTAGQSIHIVYLYMTNMMVVATDDDDSRLPPFSEASEKFLPLSSCDYFIIVKEPAGTKMLGFLSGAAAHRSFDSLPPNLPAFLYCKSNQSLINARHQTGILMMLTRYLVLSVNQVMPSGNWREVCSNGETWRDPSNKRYQLRCMHTNAKGNQVLHEMTFASAKSIVDFENGRLVLVKDIWPED
ncbi:hypothetical protein DL93DRAFT_2234554 [Clavulina sp. PMI_390]|nr:hypothetical protein DL93DRAFT_2234554 [Clavulina sp. PMI_390]